MTLNMGYAVSTVVLMVIFVITVVFQLSSNSYHPFLYWTVILSTTMAGTTISDYMDRTLDLGYPAGAVILTTILLSFLVVWRLSTGSLSVDTIKTPKVEISYWAAILFSNTLGTAFGDFLAESSGHGFGGWRASDYGSADLDHFGQIPFRDFEDIIVLGSFRFDPPLGRDGGRPPHQDPRARRLRPRHHWLLGDPFGVRLWLHRVRRPERQGTLLNS